MTRSLTATPYEASGPVDPASDRGAHHMLDRFFSGPERTEGQERSKLLAMMGLYFLVLFAVGILRPIRNALALDGLGDTRFYQVYLVSGVVIFAVPPYNRLANRIQWRILIPAVAAFFALALLVLRLLYSDGSTVFGMVFYGYYDLFAAALVTQFFMAVQVFFNARNAKSAIPLVIVGGSLGATMGGFTTGLLSEAIGAPNLMLVASAFIAAFAAALPFVWAGYPPIRPPSKKARKQGFSATEFARVFSHRHIRLIAALVLITVLAKTMVDYEFNEVTRMYVGNRDAISSFQGWVLGATQWLPILVLLVLGPVLKRWGVGLAVLILPVVMLMTTLGLALVFGVWMAVAAKAADSTFRYSAERTAREVLYVPVPTDLKLRAKAYVDMALEKGVGKVLSALVIFLLLPAVGMRGIPWVIAALCVVWTLGALAVRREYLAALSDSIRGRFASLQGGFATLTERSTLAFIEDALRGDPIQAAFALDLVEEAGRVDAQPLADEMELLLDHDAPELRARVLRLLARFPGLVPQERIRASLSDPAQPVRQGAVAALAAGVSSAEDRVGLLRGLLDSPEPLVRHATLSALIGGDVACERSAVIGRDYVLERLNASGPELPRTAEAREELALALGLVHGEDPAPGVLERLLDDSEPRVARAALLSAGVLGRADLAPRILHALSRAELHEVARTSLVELGERVMDSLRTSLMDPKVDRRIRLRIPGVMARISTRSSVEALLEALTSPGLERGLQLRILEALDKLRGKSDPVETLQFDPVLLLPLVRGEADRAERYRVLRGGVRPAEGSSPGVDLLGRALDEAWLDCRECVFRALGLVFERGQMRQAHLTLRMGDERARANAVEWLEETLGRELFVDLEPVFSPRNGRKGGRSDDGLRLACAELGSDRDEWLARVAEWTLTNHCDEGREDGGRTRGEGSTTMDHIEKVFLLQKVDLLQEARSSHLALLASIAEEVDVDEGEEIIREGTINESLYVVTRGSVELRGMGDQRIVVQENTPFGTWALIDSDPSVVGARAAEPASLLRITRSDFQDLLADQPELAVGMLQGLARRLRSLVA